MSSPDSFMLTRHTTSATPTSSDWDSSSGTSRFGDPLSASSSDFPPEIETPPETPSRCPSSPRKSSLGRASDESIFKLECISPLLRHVFEERDDVGYDSETEGLGRRGRRDDRRKRLLLLHHHHESASSECSTPRAQEPSLSPLATPKPSSRRGSRPPALDLFVIPKYERVVLHNEEEVPAGANQEDAGRGATADELDKRPVSAPFIATDDDRMSSSSPLIPTAPVLRPTKMPLGLASPSPLELPSPTMLRRKRHVARVGSPLVQYPPLSNLYRYPSSVQRPALSSPHMRKGSYGEKIASLNVLAANPPVPPTLLGSSRSPPVTSPNTTRRVSICSVEHAGTPVRTYLNPLFGGEAGGKRRATSGAGYNPYFGEAALPPLWRGTGAGVNTPHEV